MTAGHIDVLPILLGFFDQPFGCGRTERHDAGDFVCAEHIPEPDVNELQGRG